MSASVDLLVVGGGTAGLVSATTAATFGARVVLVERERTGGDCLWTGCVPSKSLLAAAAQAAAARHAGRLGIRTGGVAVEFAAVMEHVRAVIRTIEPVDSPAALEAEGVRVLPGDLTFTGPHTAWVGTEQLEFDQAVICTGSSPSLPAIPGLADASPLDSDSVWDLSELPGRLAVLGGGSVGCELGQAFARLGAEVTVIASEDRILSREVEDASAHVARSLARDGVTLRTGVRVAGVSTIGGSGVLALGDGTTLEVDRVLVAAGRRARTKGLGLDRAKVATDDEGFVRVDTRLRTSNPTIWAAGDVTGHQQLTHLAGLAGSVAATNAVLGLGRRLDTAAVPRVTYTDPEVATVGVGSSDAAGRPGLRVVRCDHDHVDRALADDDALGFSELVVANGGRILGGTVVGPRAGETIGEITLAVRHRLRTRDLATTAHAYPTYNDGVWNAAIDDVRTRLTTPTARRSVRALRAVRRRWVRCRPRKGEPA